MNFTSRSSLSLLTGGGRLIAVTGYVKISVSEASLHCYGWSEPSSSLYYTTNYIILHGGWTALQCRAQFSDLSCRLDCCAVLLLLLCHNDVISRPGATEVWRCDHHKNISQVLFQFQFKDAIPDNNSNSSTESRWLSAGIFKISL